MSPIIDVEIPAGPTIEDAVKSCVEFAARNNCVVRTKINDITMLIAYGPNFTKHPGQPYSIQDCTDFFVEIYKNYLNRAEKENKEFLERFD